MNICAITELSDLASTQLAVTTKDKFHMGVLHERTTEYFLDVLIVTGRALVASHYSKDEYHDRKMIFDRFCIDKEEYKLAL